MIFLEEYFPKIHINLENGLYVFDSQSALGKTRLRKELRKLQQYGMPVSSYSYEDYQLGIPIESILDSKKFNLILLDRYDMYKGTGIDLIKECAKKSIILIDCKGDLGFSAEYYWCTIEMTDRLIEVIE